MKKKIYALCAVLAVMLLLIAPIQVQAASKKQVYKAYTNWIKKGAEYGWVKYNKFALIYLDGDNIPELVGQKVDGSVTTFVIVSYKGKGLVMNVFASGVARTGGFRGGVTYLPKKGKIYASAVSSGTGEGSDEIYKLTKTGFKRAISGRYRLGVSGSYVWNGKKMSQTAYWKKLNSVFNTKKAKQFTKIKFVSKKSILKKLK